MQRMRHCCGGLGQYGLGFATRPFCLMNSLHRRSSPQRSLLLGSAAHLLKVQQLGGVDAFDLVGQVSHGGRGVEASTHPCLQAAKTPSVAGARQVVVSSRGAYPSLVAHHALVTAGPHDGAEELQEVHWGAVEQGRLRGGGGGAAGP